MNARTINRFSAFVVFSAAVLTIAKLLSLWMVGRANDAEAHFLSFTGCLPYVPLAGAISLSRKSRSAAVATYVGILTVALMGFPVFLVDSTRRWAGLDILFWNVLQLGASAVIVVAAAILAWRFKSPEVPRSPLRFSIRGLMSLTAAVALICGAITWGGAGGGAVCALAMSVVLVIAGLSLRKPGLCLAAGAIFVVGSAFSGVMSVWVPVWVHRPGRILTPHAVSAANGGGPAGQPVAHEPANGRSDVTGGCVSAKQVHICLRDTNADLCQFIVPETEPRT